jgi:hypothetical protein
MTVTVTAATVRSSPTYVFYMRLRAQSKNRLI